MGASSAVRFNATRWSNVLAAGEKADDVRRRRAL